MTIFEETPMTTTTGADEDEAQTTDQTPPQDAAVTSEIPATRASDDCCMRSV